MLEKCGGDMRGGRRGKQSECFMWGLASTDSSCLFQTVSSVECGQCGGGGAASEKTVAV